MALAAENGPANLRLKRYPVVLSAMVAYYLKALRSVLARGGLF